MSAPISPPPEMVFESCKDELGDCCWGDTFLFIASIVEPRSGHTIKIFSITGSPDNGFRASQRTFFHRPQKYFFGRNALDSLNPASVNSCCRTAKSNVHG